MSADKPASPVTRTGDGVLVAVRVTPKASAARIGGTVADPDGRRALKIAVTAAPDGGKANAAVIALLARSWRVPKSSISIQSGAAARRKILRVKGDFTTLKHRIESTTREDDDG